MQGDKKTIFVGLSGGVDSSVSAKRLLDHGYDVVGVFIKTWQPDFLVCNWEAERLDAMRVAAHLGIPFFTFDAVETYKHEVADYMIREYTAGRTPNPDVMCNQYVKFGAFIKYARRMGAHGVATGHYARIERKNNCYSLIRSIDTDKDQSYFLWTLTQEQLAYIYFPVGDTLKSTVREEARRVGIPTFAKQDSQGVCFLGQIDMKEFLSHYITTEEGIVLNEAGNHIGTHDGALFYTIGQRHGFTILTQGVQSTPHYVIKKDMRNNTITASTKQHTLTEKQVLLSHVNKICTQLPQTAQAQFRYRQKPFSVKISNHHEDRIMITVLNHQIEIPSIGQSCVLYVDDECVGGGIIERIE